MRHRHLNDDVGWSKAAIDSVLERGNFADWRELYTAARSDRAIAESIVAVARDHPIVGASPLAEYLALILWPDVDAG